MKLNKIALALGMAAATTVLGGCAATATHQAANQGWGKADQETQSHLKAEEQARDRATRDSFAPKVEPHAYVNTTPIPIKRDLPAVFNKEVVLNEPYPAPLEQVMGKLSRSSGMVVRYEHDIVDAGQRASGEVGQQQRDSAGMAGNPAMANGAQVIDISGMSQGGDRVEEMKISVSSQGTLREVLDATANAMNANWRYNPEMGGVEFFRYLTKTYQVSMLPGVATNEIDLETRESGSTGGAKADLNYESELSVWKSISDTLNTMISSKGAFTVSESTGTVTIRDVPDVVNRAGSYIEKINDEYSRQVSVKVKVYKVVDNSSDSRGINWDAVFTSDRFTGSLTSTALQPNSAADGLASLVLGVNPDSNVPWGGTEGLIDSLSKLGKVSVVTNTSVQTINNQPAPVRISKKVAYLKSVTETSTANVGASTSLTPGEVDTGFSMQVLPHVKENGRDMLMQVMISLSTLDTIREFSSGESTIQLPEVSSRDFVQRAWLRSGQSLVLAGFESTETGTDTSGVFDASAWFAGGSKSAENKKESIVVVITPVVSANKNVL